MAAACEAAVVSFDGRSVLGPLSITFESGELTLLVGPNGAGKSTLLNLLAGAVKPAQGRVLAFGFEAGTQRAAARTALIPQYPILYEDISVEEQLVHVARLYQVSDPLDAVNTLLDSLGLREVATRSPLGLAAGHRQACSVALGLIRPADLLLADEPLTNLDAERREAAWALIAGHARRGVCVVVATHDEALVGGQGRRVTLREGRVSGDGRDSTR